ncbi:MAG: PEP-CTERM sorting domain-containing protein, partial [Thermoplasmatota archaeon]
YLSWEGVLQVKAGSSDFDVQLTPGQESYGGGCCYYAMDGKAVAATATAAPSAAGGSGMAGAEAASADDGSSDAGQVQYEDLGGGLGPYNAAERSDAIANDDQTEASDKGAPAPGILLALAALGAVLVLRRRQT